MLTLLKPTSFLGLSGYMVHQPSIWLTLHQSHLLCLFVGLLSPQQATTARYHREKQQTRQHLPAKPASKLPQQRGVQCLQVKGHITMEAAGLQQLLLLLLGLRSDPTGQLLAVEIQVLILSLSLDKHDATKEVYLSRPL